MKENAWEPEETAQAQKEAASFAYKRRPGSKNCFQFQWQWNHAWVQSFLCGST